MKSSGKSAYYQDMPLLQEAREAWSRKDYRQSLRMFERAVKREPNNLMALKDAAYAFGQHFKIDQATRYIKRMAQWVGDDAGALHVAADAWRDAYRPCESLATYNKALDTGKALPETYLSLAKIQERSHQVDAAMESVETFLHAKPKSVEGLRLKALILRRLGEIEDAKDVYRSLKNDCRAGDQYVLAQGLNELAQIHDSEHDYDTAMSLIKESKAILRHLPNTAAMMEREQQERSWFNGFLEGLRSDHFEEWQSSGTTSDRSPVMLTGCPRSGTTLIEKALDAHSCLVSAEELSVFSTYVVPGLLRGIDDASLDADALSLIPRSVLRRESRDYYRMMEAGINERVGDRMLIDKVPSNTMLIPLMLRLMPDTRILYALRDPRDIVISCFFCWMEQNSVSVCFHSLEETIERTVCELEWWLRIKEVLPADRWCETRYEDTVSDLSGESEKLIDWMGLAWEDGVLNYRDQLMERGVKSPTYEAVSQPIYSGAVARWRHYEKYLEPYLGRLEVLANKFGY